MTIMARDIALNRSIAWLEVSGSEINLSTSMLLFLGMAPDFPTVSMENFLSFVHADDVQIVSAAMSERTGLQPSATLFRMVLRDGSVKLVSLAAHDLVRDGGGARFSFLEHSAAPERAPSIGEAPSRHGTWSIVDLSRDLGMSQPARTCLGMADDDRLIVSAVLKAVAPEDRDRAAAMLTGSDPSPLPVSFEMARFDTGVSVRCELSFDRFLDPSRPALGRCGTMTDVTERDLRDRQLDRLRGVIGLGLDMLIEGVAVMNDRGEIDRLNGAGRTVLGDIPVGGSLWERHPGLETDQLRQEFRHVREGARAVEDERYVPALRHWLAYRLFRLGSEVVFVFRSMDDDYRVRAAFDQLAERTRLASTLGGVALWEYDHQADRIWIVPSSRLLLGTGVMCYAELQARIVLDDRAAVDEARRRALTDGVPFEIEFRVYTSDGDTKVLRARGAPVPGSADRSSRFVGVLIDAESRADSQSTVASASSRPRDGQAVISGAQVRAARGALRWSVRELAEHSDVSVATINRFEAGSTVVTTRDRSVLALHKVLLSEGSDFCKDEQGRPAISIGAPNVPLGNGVNLEAASRERVTH